MAILGINDFKSKLIGGGARNNLFKVTCNFPAYARGNVELASFMIKTAQLPSSIITPITIPFRGRQLQIAGDRQFEAWGISVINDTSMDIRNSFERWMSGINANAVNTGRSNPADYTVDMAVEQLNKAGEVTKRYDLRGVFPTAVSAIDLSFDSENTVEEFSVELQMLYWESEQSV
jgi:hypothetical protein